jgi:predicted nucleotidyltransferase
LRKPLSDVAAEALTVVFEKDSMIQVAYLFGSRCKGTNVPESDIDVAVLLAELPDEMLDYYLDLIGRLSEVLGDNVDLVVLNAAPPLLRHQVISCGKVIYSRDERARVEFEARAEREYLDFSRFKERYDERMMEELVRWKG